MVFEAHHALREAGIALRPTFVPFTPWETREGYAELVRWIARDGLVEAVDAIQLTLRLLIPPRSLLLANESLRPHLGELDAAALTYRWAHPDPEMDRLQQSAAALVEDGVARSRSNHQMFHHLQELALGDVEYATATPLRAPRLSETWFC
jgi:hypothetical protein